MILLLFTRFEISTSKDIHSCPDPQNGQGLHLELFCFSERYGEITGETCQAPFDFLKILRFTLPLAPAMFSIEVLKFSTDSRKFSVDFLTISIGCLRLSIDLS